MYCSWRDRISPASGSPGFAASQLLDGLPVKRLVTVPVVLGRGDHRDDREPRGLEDDHRSLERRPRLVPVLVVVRQGKPPPVRLAHDDVATRPDRRRERVEGVGKAAIDEARAEAQRSVVGLRLERRGGTVAELERHAIREPGLGDPLDRDGVEVRRRARLRATCIRTHRRAAEPDLLGPRRCRAPATRARARAAGRGGGASSGDVGFWSSCPDSATTK